ncbi:MAG: Sua5/YciO/YrdC/YwlC family protein [Planctomycetes bacterium]|nr:Sua5/YciO/YrdC/YwlC family protein [Planctomycetota bacterium]
MIHQAVQLLSDGELVAFPTETVYAVAADALNPAGVEKLLDLFDLAPEASRGCVLGVKGMQQAQDYIPHMSLLGGKLARRCWPGPVTIQYHLSHQEGLLDSLPPETRTAVLANDDVSLRTPAHDVILEALRLMPAPLVLSPESNSDVLTTTAGEVQSRFGERVSLIVDDGSCRYGQPSTVVQVTDDQWKVIRPGVVTESMLGRLVSEVYLFVCTGNTCRSPMAEGLFRKFLAERLQCTEEELFDRGYVVESAGLAAAIGAPASSESIEITQQRGVDLRAHASQPLTDRLLEQADHIYTMTQGHMNSILAARPDVSDRLDLLSGEKVDISDPIGGGKQGYEICEQEIEKQILAILDQINF